MADREHGTHKGYYQHLAAGEKACQACKAGAARYMKERRAASPEVYKASDQRKYAHKRARTKLAANHPEEYRELFETEMNRQPGE